VNGAIYALFWIFCICLVAYSIFRNLRDAHRAQELQKRNSDLQVALQRPLTVDTAKLAAELFTEIKRRPEEEPKQVQPPDRPDPDLRGEFLEILFKPHIGEWTSRSTLILAKLRIANHGSRKTTITNWMLHVQVGPESYVPTAERIDIPSGWRIERGFNDRQLIDPIPEDAYEPGIPKTGWVLFDFSAYPTIGRGHPAAPHNARFLITIRDAYNQEHTITKEADWYYTSGEVVDLTLELPSLPS
jgi:hypothetical protein